MFMTSNLHCLYNAANAIRGPNYLAVLKNPMQLVLRRNCFRKRSYGACEPLHSHFFIGDYLAKHKTSDGHS